MSDPTETADVACSCDDAPINVIWIDESAGKQWGYQCAECEQMWSCDNVRKEALS